MKKPLAEQFRRNTAISMIAVFFILLWLPTMDLLFRLDRSPTPNENRDFAKFPPAPTTLAKVREFPIALENYFRDHFGFRNLLIRTERRWKHDLFKESPSADVIIGNDGWLYFSGDYMMETFQGKRMFTPGQLRDWKTLLEKRRDWLAQRGVKYLFVIAPDKQSIYPEFLPDWLLKRAGPSKLDQFLAYIKTNSTVEVLDLRPALQEAKSNAWAYLQTDTHWNAYGAFKAYQTLVTTLSKQLPDLTPPFPESMFDVRPVVNPPKGDLIKQLGSYDLPQEKNAVEFVIHPPYKRLPPVDVSNLLPPRKLPYYKLPTATIFDQASGKAIVFHDSFAVLWRFFLGYHFHEVIYLWQYEMEPELIEREKPTFVIDEMLERMFDGADPAELMKADALPGSAPGVPPGR